MDCILPNNVTESTLNDSRIEVQKLLAEIALDIVRKSSVCRWPLLSPRAEGIDPQRKPF